MIHDWRNADCETVRLLVAMEFTRRSVFQTDPVRGIFWRGRLWMLSGLINHLGMRKELETDDRERKIRAADEARRFRTSPAGER